MSVIIIGKASANDVETLIAIGKETFHETFSLGNTEENMVKYLEANFSSEKLTSELNNPNSSFYIAWHDSEPVGYLKVNQGKAQTELQDKSALEIERIYVKSAYHGKKAGQMLYEKALDVAMYLNKKSIWLGVWEENHRAIKFYEKNGFVAFSKHIFKMGNDKQTDIMMRKLL